MEATELIELIRTSEKKTPVRVVLQANAPCEFPGAEVFSGGNGLHILYGDWKTLGPQLTAQAAHITACMWKTAPATPPSPCWTSRACMRASSRAPSSARARRSARTPSLCMGAILNLGAVVGEGSMIDMGAVLGGRATVGKNCHIGAGAVLAGEHRAAQRHAGHRGGWRARRRECRRARGRPSSEKMPSSRPEPSSRRTCRRMPSWRARPPACWKSSATKGRIPRPPSAMPSASCKRHTTTLPGRAASGEDHLRK